MQEPLEGHQPQIDPETFVHTGAVLTGAVLTGAVLTGAVLTGVK